MWKRRVLTGLATLVLAWPVPAGETPEAANPDPVAEVAETVRVALDEGNYVAVTKACEQAKALRPDCRAAEFEPVMQAVARGVKHRDVGIAIVSVRTLPALDMPDAGRYLRSLLSPPKRVKPERWNLHLAAIEAAGAIHDPGSIADLVKLLRHPTTDFAVAGARALAWYVKADRDTRRDVVGRLAKWLGRFEKATPRTTLARVRHGLVMDATVDALRTLTREPKIATAADARAWLVETEDQEEPETIGASAPPR